MDSIAAISLLSDRAHQHGIETAQFQELRKRDWTVLVKHTYRETTSTDFLASLDYDYPFGSHTILISNCNLGFYLLYDCMGIFEL
ncbi:hypothetical protein LINPERHAP2_LOCUS26876 [Linum perenne]